ncbi:hypothetical protein ACVWYG_002223 [Pedobacter sp. UYEF25]
METTFKNQSKNNLLFALAVMLLIAFNGCGRLAPSFSGTYVNNAGSKVSVAYDTLIVEQMNAENYNIHRKTRFSLIDDKGRTGRPQYETEEWTAIYDPKTLIMTERRNGKLITFDIEKGTMTVSKRKYKRIK